MEFCWSIAPGVIFRLPFPFWKKRKKFLYRSWSHKSLGRRIKLLIWRIGIDRRRRDFKRSLKRYSYKERTFRLKSRRLRKILSKLTKLSMRNFL
jgi:hypothetical protein